MMQSIGVVAFILCQLMALSGALLYQQLITELNRVLPNEHRLRRVFHTPDLFFRVLGEHRRLFPDSPFRVYLGAVTLGVLGSGIIWVYVLVTIANARSKG